MSENFGFVKASTIHRLDPDFIPTGSLYMDLLLGGGLVAGSINEFYGPPQSGKTFMANKVAAEVQKGVILASSGRELPRDAGYVDIENRYNKTWGSKCGVDMDLLSIQSDYIFIEDALGAYVAAADSRQFGLLVYDSVGASQAKEQADKPLEGQAVTAHMTRAKMMKNGLNTLVAAMRKRDKSDILDYNPTCCIFLNHILEKMGNSNYTVKYSPGGDHLRYMATARVEFAISEAKDNRIFVKMGSNEHVVGQKVFFKIKKVSSAGTKDHDGWFIMYRQDCVRDGIEHEAGSIDRIQEIADILASTPIGRMLDVQSGNWYNINGEKLNGVKQLAEYLNKEPDARVWLEDAILAAGKELY